MKELFNFILYGITITVLGALMFFGTFILMVTVGSL